MVILRYHTSIDVNLIAKSTNISHTEITDLYTNYIDNFLFTNYFKHPVYPFSRE